MRKKQKPPAYQPRRQPAQSSSGSSVFSYYSNRSTRESDTVRHQYVDTAARDKLINRQWVKNLPSLIAMGVVFVSVMYCLGLDTNPKVLLPAASSTNAALRERADYQAGANRLLDKSFFNRSKLTVDTSGFAQDFMRQFPEVSNVTVSLPLVGRRPVVSIETAQPVLLWAANHQVYILDNRGKIIMKSDDLASSLRDKLPSVTDDSGAPAEVGKTVLPATHVQFLTTVIAQLRAQQLAIQSVSLPALPQEVHVRLEGEQYFIKFNMAATDARVAAGAFLAAKDKLDRDNVKPAEYMDARIEERVYYK